jgi:hypothetical protein
MHETTACRADHMSVRPSVSARLNSIMAKRILIIKFGAEIMPLEATWNS